MHIGMNEVWIARGQWKLRRDGTKQFDTLPVKETHVVNIVVALPLDISTQAYVGSVSSCMYHVRNTVRVGGG